MWRFPKIRGTFSGVPIVRIIVYWGLYWGPLIGGIYHVGLGTWGLQQLGLPFWPSI